MFNYLKQCWVLWKWNRAIAKGLKASGIPLLHNLPVAERAAHETYRVGECVVVTSDKHHIQFNAIERSQMVNVLKKARMSKAETAWLGPINVAKEYEQNLLRNIHSVENPTAITGVKKNLWFDKE